eukprot:TRINITY_DN6063_c0_g3_i1.p1 TRINITY_DN6063_c0_g3~~TRINITY_DN6063_c0_g3_i1.p1  ORF type:complete len:1409 (+),score=357.56 TRINITY_DN6063_c0_g3_i1:98-4324(+)
MGLPSVLLERIAGTCGGDSFADAKEEFSKSEQLPLSRQPPPPRISMTELESTEDGSSTSPSSLNGGPTLPVPEELVVKRCSDAGSAAPDRPYSVELTWFYDEEVIDSLSDPAQRLKSLNFEVRQQSEVANGRLRTRVHTCECRSIGSDGDVQEQCFQLDGCQNGRRYLLSVRACGRFGGVAEPVYSAFSEVISSDGSPSGVQSSSKEALPSREAPLMQTQVQSCEPEAVLPADVLAGTMQDIAANPYEISSYLGLSSATYEPLQKGSSEKAEEVLAPPISSEGEGFCGGGACTPQAGREAAEADLVDAGAYAGWFPTDDSPEKLSSEKAEDTESIAPTPYFFGNAAVQQPGRSLFGEAASSERHEGSEAGLPFDELSITHGTSVAAAPPCADDLRPTRESLTAENLSAAAAAAPVKAGGFASAFESFYQGGKPVQAASAGSNRADAADVCEEEDAEAEHLRRVERLAAQRLAQAEADREAIRQAEEEAAAAAAAVAAEEEEDALAGTVQSIASVSSHVIRPSGQDTLGTTAQSATGTTSYVRQIRPQQDPLVTTGQSVAVRQCRQADSLAATSQSVASSANASTAQDRLSGTIDSLGGLRQRLDEKKGPSSVPSRTALAVAAAAEVSRCMRPATVDAPAPEPAASRGRADSAAYESAEARNLSEETRPPPEAELQQRSEPGSPAAGQVQGSCALFSPADMGPIPLVPLPDSPVGPKANSLSQGWGPAEASGGSMNKWMSKILSRSVPEEEAHWPEQDIPANGTIPRCDALQHTDALGPMVTQKLGIAASSGVVALQAGRDPMSMTGESVQSAAHMSQTQVIVAKLKQQQYQQEQQQLMPTAAAARPASDHMAVTVLPQQPQTVVGSNFVVGEAVHIWSNSKKAWMTDGEVVEVLTAPMMSDGGSLPLNTIIPSGAVKVNSGAGTKWVLPEVVSTQLRKACPTFAFVRGEAVHVWSKSNNAWLTDGVVKEVSDGSTLFNGVLVPAGALHVSSSAGEKWVMPEQVASTLRKAGTPAVAAETVGAVRPTTSFGSQHSVRRSAGLAGGAAAAPEVGVGGLGPTITHLPKKMVLPRTQPSNAPAPPAAATGQLGDSLGPTVTSMAKPAARLANGASQVGGQTRVVQPVSAGGAAPAAQASKPFLRSSGSFAAAAAAAPAETVETLDASQRLSKANELQRRLLGQQPVPQQQAPGVAGYARPATNVLASASPQVSGGRSPPLVGREPIGATIAEMPHPSQSSREYPAAHPSSSSSAARAAYPQSGVAPSSGYDTIESLPPPPRTSSFHSQDSRHHEPIGGLQTLSSIAPPPRRAPSFQGSGGDRLEAMRSAVRSAGPPQGGLGGNGRHILEVLVSDGNREELAFTAGDDLHMLSESFLQRCGLKSTFAPGLHDMMCRMVERGLQQQTVDIIDLL